ncbi:hypothetical protein HH310_19720 [Actinoplanes sp. TBRC 11911]|uniref:hypothetical protein n=1 Tax=Actinoplanes sp. TBRC 11911 TaxID=2729386 RepID=UPI00145D2BF6|nr:hypothetical protein [Actinoplanes sp. TBRC 11911]NMO53405.1 hypothetical protein [Actinoplanes sp. TBRC 11911]
MTSLTTRRGSKTKVKPKPPQDTDPAPTHPPAEHPPADPPPVDDGALPGTDPEMPPPPPSQAPPPPFRKPGPPAPPKPPVLTRRDAEPSRPVARTSPTSRLRTLDGDMTGLEGAQRTAVLEQFKVEMDTFAAKADVSASKQFYDQLKSPNMNRLTKAERYELLAHFLSRQFLRPDLPQMAADDPEFFRSVLSFLTGKTAPADSELSRETRAHLAFVLLEAACTPTAVAALRPKGEDLIVDMLSSASRLADDPAMVKKLNLKSTYFYEKLGALGEDHGPIACAAVRNYWMENTAGIGSAMYKWIFGTISTAEWNRAGTELAARGINLLWNNRDYGRIAALLNDGVDPTKSARAYDGVKREGVWTGYVQPITHLLGKYLKSIKKLDTPEESSVTDAEKVRGAKLLVERLLALPSPPKLLLDYDQVERSRMVEMFKAFPGTIWGFEDVRLPYVQAARDTGHGQQPLRMLDMWEVIQPILNPDTYVDLIKNPDATIEKQLDEAAKVVREGIRSGNPQYAGMKEDPYVKNFIEVSRSYLKFLSKRPPYAKYLEKPAVMGKDQGKLLPSYACKTGIWWSLSQDPPKPLYYCLDGINMSDVTNYKKYKTAQINTYLQALEEDPKNADKYHPFQEVITLAEMREILQHWDKFRDMVRFVEMGEVLSPEETRKRVTEWIGQMEVADKTSEQRGFRGEWDLVEEARKLIRDDDVFWSKTPPKTRRDCVKEAQVIKLAATADAQLLTQILSEGCASLIEAGQLPKNLGALYDAARKAEPGPARDEAVAALWTRFFLTGAGLRQMIRPALIRDFGAKPDSVPDVPDVNIDPGADLDVGPEGVDQAVVASLPAASVPSPGPPPTPQPLGTVTNPPPRGDEF